MDKLILSNASEQLTQATTKELGESLTAEAARREQEERENRVVGEVQRLMQAHGDYLRKAEFATRAANWYAQKLDAIRAGEFTLNLVTGLMSFKDEELDRANY